MTQSTLVSKRSVQRSRAILQAFEWYRNEEIATLVELNRKQVGLWRGSWKKSPDPLRSERFHFVRPKMDLVTNAELAFKLWRIPPVSPRGRRFTPAAFQYRL